MSDTTTVPVPSLRKVLQSFNEELGQYINADERFKLGRVLTIIDASIGDPEQRKAIKDLVQNEWWGGARNRPYETAMTNPHTDLRAICKVFGFELYEPTANTLAVAPSEANNEEFITKRYEKIAKEDN